MSKALTLELGSTVRTRDGLVCKLVRIILEPESHRVTHIVVKPQHAHDVERLVPIERCTSCGDDVTLACTRSEFAQFEQGVEREVFIVASETLPDTASIYSYPFLSYDAPIGRAERTRVVTSDRVPYGEVEVRGGTHVHAADCTVGNLCGVLVDPESHRMTHLLLEVGHLWTQREVAIPTVAVTAVENGRADVSWPKAQIESLEPVGVGEAEVPVP